VNNFCLAVRLPSAKLKVGQLYCCPVVATRRVVISGVLLFSIVRTPTTKSARLIHYLSRAMPWLRLNRDDDAKELSQKHRTPAMTGWRVLEPV